MKKTTRVPVGATYAPLAKATEVDVSEWDADLERFAKLGLNTFRLFIAWDRIEIKRGVKDFSKVDLAFELAAKHRLQVIANVGGTFTNLQAIYPPRWLLSELDCQRVVEDFGAEANAVPPRIKLCYDDPKFQREAMSFIKEAVARYKDRPELIAWSGWNEPRKPNCFCRHTLALYREWLKRKYGALEKLNAAWSSEFPLEFGSWDEINPQLKTGFEHGGYAPWMDWDEFRAWNRAEKFRLVTKTIKEVDEEHPVLSHLCGPHDSDTFDCEDIGGTSIYTYFHNGRERGELSDAKLNAVLRWNSAWMASGYRKDRYEPESFWVLETEAGPVSWVHNLMPKTYSARKMNARDMIFVGSGARCVLRWLYRSRISDSQAGEFNLVGWDGSTTERAEEFGRLAKFLDANANLFLNSAPAKEEVAILTEQDGMERLFQAEEMAQKYIWLRDVWHAILADAGFQAKPITSKQIYGGRLDGVKALVVPMRPYVDAKLAAALEDFAAKGGLVVAESPFATKDMRGVHWERTPGSGLDEVFKVQVYDLEKLFEDKCGGIPAFDFKAIMRLKKGAKVEAKFEDGAPAIVSSVHGKGGALLFASIVSARYEWANGAPLRKTLRKSFERVGAKPWHKLECAKKDGEATKSVLYRGLPDGASLLTVVNFGEDFDKLKITLERFGARPEIEALGASDADMKLKISGNTVGMDAKPFAWAVLKIKPDLKLKRRK